MVYLTISLISLMYGIDTSLAMNLAHVESSFNPKAYSRTGDGGLFQLNSKYYKFHNPKWIYNIQINTFLAMKTLQDLKESCVHKLHNTYIVCYNLGRSGAKKIKKPQSQTYFKKVNYVWRR